MGRLQQRRRIPVDLGQTVVREIATRLVNENGQGNIAHLRRDLNSVHTALRPDDAVDRIGALSKTHNLPVVGASFGGAMWDGDQHAQVMEDAELVVPRLAQVGGRTLGVSVGTIQWGAKHTQHPF